MCSRIGHSGQLENNSALASESLISKHPRLTGLAHRVVGRKMRRWQQTLASADGQEFQRLKRYLRVLFKAPAGMSELEQLRRTGVQSGDV